MGVLAFRAVCGFLVWFRAALKLAGLRGFLVLVCGLGLLGLVVSSLGGFWVLQVAGAWCVEVALPGICGLYGVCMI